jgi:hypothetical protein
LAFVRMLLGAQHIPRICLENPVSIISSRIAKPTQIIQPWMFGHGQLKTTCLWLKSLKRLRSTKVIPENCRANDIHYMAPSPDRWKDRSRTFRGIAEAMAEQWGSSECEWSPSGWGLPNRSVLSPRN